jgi:hypothetical protein
VPLVRLDGAGKNLQQRGLTRSIGADQTNFVTAHDDGGEIPDIGPAAITAGNALRLKHQLAGAFGILGLQSGNAEDRAAGAIGRAHFFEPTHAALVAGPSGLDPLADPRLFPRQFFFE